jgi:hypothetical protein
MCLVTVCMSDMSGHLGETLHGIEIRNDGDCAPSLLK